MVSGPVQLTDASGAVVAGDAYTAQGAVQAKTGTASTVLQFAGQYVVAEKGFLYLQARYFDPVTALFLSVDPLVGATHEAYLCAGNNPPNAPDPLGLWDWMDTVGIGIGPVAFALTGVGAVVEVSAAVGWVGVGLGAVRAGLDLYACVGGDNLGCGGAVFNGLAAGGGVAGIYVEGGALGVGMDRATLPYAATGLGLDSMGAAKTFSEEDERDREAESERDADDAARH
ncbi:hypothetical protein C5C18_10205 [Rathayibacter tritici]|nr:hypothetical protein C5C21_07040 [Rathayibacter tritici]PPG06569.1 hypothetical protein C5C18_10205 [Rathayibacter tritici]